MSSKPLLKTIHVEKEVLICETERGPPLIMDIGIYTEIIEDLSTQRVLNNTFEVTTCAKTFDGTILGCISKEPPTTLPTLDCHLQRQLELPTPSIEMNTVVSSGGVVPLIKTIEAHKEVFECKTDLYPIIKDVIIFTEMFENLDEMVTLKRASSLQRV
jgi:hypothetical protein